MLTERAALLRRRLGEVFPQGQQAEALVQRGLWPHSKWPAEFDNV